MAKSPPHHITEEMLNALRGQSARERVLHRLHSVALVLKGHSASAAGALYGDSPRAVAYWVKRFRQDGIKGLEDESRPGRPSKLSAAHFRTVQTFLKQSAAKSKHVTADILRAFLMEKCRVTLTSRQCWRILKKLMT